MVDPLDPTRHEPDLARPDPSHGWRDRVEGLADATGSTPGRLATGAALAVVGIVAALWFTRPAPVPPEVSLPFASTTAVPLAVATSTTIPTELVIHVAGAVQQPGVHRVAAGSRVVDAIEAGGGLAPQADAARLNLAAPVVDGERVYVPAVGEASPPAVVGATGNTGSDAPAGPLNLNTATAEDLDRLPGVGPATAAAIIEHRERIGGFTSVDQLLDVRGIGDAKLDQLRSLVTV